MSPTTKAVLLALLFSLGAALRLYRFPSVPAGLNQDELLEAYNSFCVLHTGADLWGYRLPTFFIGVGAGGDALQAYLSLPAMAIWGLTPLAVRFVALVCGLLALPLFFAVLRRWFGEAVATLGLAFLALSPWHIVLSRWGLEVNLLPFFLLLGLFLYGYALASTSPWVIVPCLLPFALSLYTYGVAVIVLPVLLSLLFFAAYDPILKNWRAWLAAFAAFLLTSAPAALFVFKTYVAKKTFGFERWLPFSVPMPEVARLGEVRSTERSILGHTLLFLSHGLRDNTSYNQVPGFLPIQGIVLGLALAGIAYQTVRLVRERRFNGPFLPWLLAGLPLLLIVPVNINEANTLYMPLLAMAAIGGVELFGAVSARWYRIAVPVVILGLFLLSAGRFVHAYFGPQYALQTVANFHPSLAAAMKEVRRRTAPNKLIYISEAIQFNSVQTLFYMKIDPQTFQHSGATYAHPDFGPYKFSRATAAQAPTPIVFLLSKGEPPLCQHPVDTQQVGEFTVGECLATK